MPLPDGAGLEYFVQRTEHSVGRTGRPRRRYMSREAESRRAPKQSSAISWAMRLAGAQGRAA